MPQQIQLIPSGVYTLFDDDIASGFTVKTIQKLLCEQNIHIAEFKTANHYTDFIDIIDASDFLLSQKNNGGLVIHHSQRVQRYNYLSDHVNLVTRAKIPNALKGIISAQLNKTGVMDENPFN